MKPLTKIPCGITIEFDSTMFLQILDRYGVLGWNAWIDSISEKNQINPVWNATTPPPSIQVEFDLSGIDLTNRELDGIDLTEVYMSRGLLSHSSLYGANILLAMRCNFIGADLRTASFNSCDISGAIFIDAMLGDNDWKSAFYYKGTPPIGLPSDVMTKLQQLAPDDVDEAQPKQIVCLADIKDASYWMCD